MKLSRFIYMILFIIISNLAIAAPETKGDLYIFTQSILRQEQEKRAYRDAVIQEKIDEKLRSADDTSREEVITVFDDDRTERITIKSYVPEDNTKDFTKMIPQNKTRDAENTFLPPPKDKIVNLEVHDTKKQEMVSSGTVDIINKHAPDPAKHGNKVIKAENKDVRVYYKINDPGMGQKVEPNSMNEQANIIVYLGARELSFKHALNITNGMIMVPLMDFLDRLTIVDGNVLHFTSDGKVITVSLDNVTLKIFVNSNYGEINGSRVKVDTPFTWTGDDIYVPLDFIGRGLGFNVDIVYDQGTNTYKARVIRGNFKQFESFANSNNISSKTEYMIWISRKDYRLTLFKGSKNNWNYLCSFECSLGSQAKPTIVGQYAYFRLDDRWSFDYYYVAPVMRFHGKYGIHSTLLKGNGEHADYRLKMNISHGCIRLKPEDINWLAKVTPIGTKVWITK